jgi:hypothetical protein
VRQGIVLKIEPDVGDTVRFVEDSTSYAAKPDGMDYPLKDASIYQADTCAFQFVDARTVISIHKRAGKVVKQYRCLSARQLAFEASILE